MIPHWLPTCGRCLSVFPCKLQPPLPETESAILQLTQEGFASLLLECPAAGGIRLGVCTQSLHGWTEPNPMLDLLSLEGMKRKKQYSTNIHMTRWLQWAHNFKCQVFTLVELRQRKINQRTITGQPPKNAKWMLWKVLAWSYFDSLLHDCKTKKKKVNHPY